MSRRAAAPAAFLIVLLLAATLYDGAYDVRHWGPVAIFALLLLATVVLVGSMRPLDRASAIAVAAIWGFAAWSVASAIWAPSVGLALEAGARNCFYAALVTVALVAVPGPREARRLGALIVGGIVLIGIVTLLRLYFDGTLLVVAGRLDAPTGYRNATACLFAIPFWALLGVAATKSRNPSLRATTFAAATLTLGLAVMTQSRGALVGLVIGGVLALYIGPEWIRRPWLALLAGLGMVLLWGPMLAAHRAFESGTVGVSTADIQTAAGALAFLVVNALIIGLLFALLDGGLRASPQNMRHAKRVAAAGLIVGTIALVVGAITVAGNPIEFVDEKLQQFQKVPDRTEELERLISTGGERFDLWRVAVEDFTGRPVAGVGEGGYAPSYYARRATGRNLTDPHSLPLAVLAETGLIGALLIGVFLAALLYAVLARGGRASLPARRAAAGLAGGAGVVLGQALVDWIWLVPGVIGLGLLCLALSAVAVTPRPPARTPAAAPRVRLLLRAAAATGLMVAALLVTAGVIADFHVGEARAAARNAPERALSEARAAGVLTPWAPIPRYLEAGALERLGRVEEARAVLRETLERSGGSFVVKALIGDLERRAENKRAAHARYREALQRNPRDIGLRRMVQKTRSREAKQVRRSLTTGIAFGVLLEGELRGRPVGPSATAGRRDRRAAPPTAR